MKRYLVIAKIGGEVSAEMMLPAMLKEFIKTDEVAGFVEAVKVFDIDPDTLEPRRVEVSEAESYTED